jgi:hypothetical protein
LTVIFGITGFLILRPISKRALASRAGTLPVAPAGWLPPVVTCVVAGLVLYLVMDVGLGLDPVHPWQMIGLTSLAAATFTTIAHFPGTGRVLRRGTRADRAHHRAAPGMADHRPETRTIHLG